MKCQKCGANNATTHVKTIINGEFKEFDLCSDCAKKMGYTNIFSDMEDEFSSFLGSFFGNALPARTESARCDFCGSSYYDIAKTGQVGCAHCYDVFEDELMPSIRRIHGNTTHCGKNSSRALRSNPDKNAEETKEDKIKRLKAELDKSVEKQEFEKAAKLRDEIKDLEAK